MDRLSEHISSYPIKKKYLLTMPIAMVVSIVIGSNVFQ